MNVLIVDDNASAAELLQELIVLQDHTARVARHLRQNAQDRPLMLVAISGYGVGDAAGAQAAPLFDHYLQKPIDFDALDRLLATPPAAA
ncbi:MAG: response regulator [Variovorax paradoxus]|uniref:Response regulator n=1 Tax=Variovorax paradoxus TaxID=34073 RepID=A0A2W5RJ44_VARPD|nr:MAG: response regulator [Variovorax paradoxus]